jgi:hypothetical protein
MAPHEVVLFLQLVRDAHAAKRLAYRGSRAKNMSTLMALGWERADMYACVAGLQPEQALCLPWDNQHPDHSSERVCEFGTEVAGRQVYVKVTVVGTSSGIDGCVVSFHFAEKPLPFPFRLH